MPSPSLSELVETIARALVDNPEQVSVKSIEGGQTVVLELYVDKTDIGKVIGKGGNTAKSIRTILSASASKNKKNAVLEIIE
ncbi:MAG: KH domain-containing protein [Pseudomonadota bacterium]